MGVGIGEGVGVDSGVGVAVGADVGVSVGEGVGVGSGVGVAVGVGAGVTVGAAVGVDVGARVTVYVTEAVIPAVSLDRIKMGPSGVSCRSATLNMKEPVFSRESGLVLSGASLAVSAPVLMAPKGVKLTPSMRKELPGGPALGTSVRRGGTMISMDAVAVRPAASITVMAFLVRVLMLGKLTLTEKLPVSSIGTTAGYGPPGIRKSPWRMLPKGVKFRPVMTKAPV